MSRVTGNLKSTWTVTALPGLDSDPANALHPKVITSRLPGTHGAMPNWITSESSTIRELEYLAKPLPIEDAKYFLFRRASGMQRSSGK
jgi:hypothetical protein